jgi:anoctamin-10
LPVAALLNNYVEAKTDLLKLLKTLQRPSPKEAASIGTWLRILELLSYLSVLTNCAIITWTSEELDGYSMYHRLLIGLALEHGILLLKLALSVLIPDAPGK